MCLPGMQERFGGEGVDQRRERRIEEGGGSGESARRRKDGR